MKPWRNILFFCFVFFLFETVSAQELKVTFPRAKSFKEEQVSYKQERIKMRQERQYSREERQAVKMYHKKLQTKKVRKRMKQNRRKSNYYNSGKGEPFYMKWFRK